jgi:hypothetical protein
MLQLAGRFGGGSPRDVDSLAPSRMEIVLAAEVPPRPTADSPSATSADSPDGKVSAAQSKNERHL